MLLNFFRILPPVRLIGLAALCMVASSGVGVAQAPLLDDRVVLPEARERLVLQWRIDAADRALRAGLAKLAEDSFRGILREESLADKTAADLRIRLASSLIAQRRFQAAGGILEAVPAPFRNDTYHLYDAVAIYGDGKRVDWDALTASLEAVSAEALSPVDLPWLHLLNGVRAEQSGEAGEARRAFETAQSVALSETQRSFFESLVLREKVLQSPADEGLAAEIRSKLNELSGREAAYPYAREYAIMLHNMGRNEAAIQVIDRERGNAEAGFGSRERDHLLLLKGLIQGANTEDGRATLRQLVREGRNRDAMGVALQLLARSSGDTPAFAEFLNELIARTSPHPLLGQMYYLRSQMALASDRPGAIAVAEADARELLEQFPGLNQITNVYRLLAYAALQRTPAQYRAAADFLIQLRDQAEDVAQRKELNRLIGDCYFLNGDYANAVDFYKAAKNRSFGLDQGGELFLRLITAEVRAGQIESALQHVDEADFTGSIDVEDRWRAEWNIAQALQARGDLLAALERVRLLLGNAGASSVPAALDLRLRWLEARLSLFAGETEGVAERVDELLARIEALPPGTLDDAVVRLLRTEMLLLKADILIQSGSAEAGMAILERIRIGFAESSAAERSYLTEANYHGAHDEFEAAQATLLKLASNYPASTLAPQALFEAALYCERRGAEYFGEAVRIHNDLAERYPEDALVYAARLKQGDLLRQMNDFAGAQIIYENLINRFPEHPRRYIAELSRADCMLALAKNNMAQLKDVALALERLIDLPNLPVDFQVEVGYKWGFALMRREAFAEAQEVFTMLSGRFLLDSGAAPDLGRTGAYWMSRTLLDLGDLLGQAGQPDAARRVYGKFDIYNLPGQSLAQARIDGLPRSD